MYYKIQEAKKEVAVRIEAELDISIVRFLCIATEIDLMQEQYEIIKLNEQRNIISQANARQEYGRGIIRKIFNIPFIIT